MGSIILGEREVTALLRAGGWIDDAANQLGIRDVLDVVATLVPCDVLFWNWIGLVPQFVEHALVDATSTEPVHRAPLEGWLEHLPEHPIMSGRNGPVVALSDVLTDPELERTWLFQVAMRPDGIRHEIGMELTHARTEMSVVVLSREHDPDFDERDHAVLLLLRPHVDAAIRRLSRPAPRLTRREREVMLLVRDGLTDGQVARRLGVAEATVGKHLEHVYARTGACSRVQAVALCGPVLEAGPTPEPSREPGRAPGRTKPPRGPTGPT